MGFSFVFLVRGFGRVNFNHIVCAVPVGGVVGLNSGCILVFTTCTLQL